MTIVAKPGLILKRKLTRGNVTASIANASRTCDFGHALPREARLRLGAFFAADVTTVATTRHDSRACQFARF
jgi:hypothetical protein